MATRARPLASVLTNFKDHTTRVLIATDIAARESTWII